jgi:hypothetical protein
MDLAKIKYINKKCKSHYHRIEIGQKLHSWVKSVEYQPTSGVAAMLKATKPEEIL